MTPPTALLNKTRLDKFAGQQIWNAGGSPKGQAARTKPDQLLDQEEEWLAKQLERDQNLSSRFRKYLMNREAVLKCSVLAPNQIRTVTGAKRRKYLITPEGVLKRIQSNIIGTANVPRRKKTTDYYNSAI